jgi:DNA (cytosine-5)-methyltransferase 1
MDQRPLFDLADGEFQKQVDLLTWCRTNNVAPEDALDDLEAAPSPFRYEIEAPEVHGDYPTLDDFRHPANDVPVVSLFSGCGGLDLGFEAAGFRHVCAAEIHPVFVETLRSNRPSWTVLGPPSHPGDVSDTEGMAVALTEMADVAGDFPGVFVGGPPCQPFSIAANQRFRKDGANFKRTGFDHRNGNLLFDYVELIELFRPAVFVVENVPGLLDIDSGEQLSIVIDRLRTSGYSVNDPMILNARNFAVPQQRLRLFLVGSRVGGNFTKPAPSETQVPCGVALRLGEGPHLNHETRMHKAESLLRYAKLRVGERDQLGRVDRLDPTIPAKTIIAGGTKGGGRSHLHPYIPRTLSVRESARLQTFPDSYRFTGPTARQFTQVGNAVPPVLAAQLATAIRVAYF